MRVCVRVFSVGFGPGLDSMSPARSRRSASRGDARLASPKNWAAGPPERRGRWIQFAQCSPDCGTVAHQPRAGYIRLVRFNVLLLLFAMIRSVVKSFKVPDVEVAAARMSNESALTRMTDSTPKKTLVRLDAGPGWMS